MLCFGRIYGSAPSSCCEGQSSQPMVSASEIHSAKLMNCGRWVGTFFGVAAFNNAGMSLLDLSAVRKA